MMRIALGRRLVGFDAVCESSEVLDLRRRVGGSLCDVGLLAGVRHRVADDVRDLLLGGARRERELLVVALAAARGRSGCGWHD